MKKLIGALAVLGLPIIALSTPHAAPVFADTPGVSPTCFPQSANPRPTDPAGSATATLFCTPPAPSPSPTPGTISKGAGTTASGSHTTLANSAATGSASTPADQGSGNAGATAAKAATRGTSPSSGGGLFGGLVGFFSATGGLVFLFGLLVLMAIVLVAVGFASWLRRGQAGGWASRARSLSFRPKS